MMFRSDNPQVLALREAVKSNNLEKVKKLLEQNVPQTADGNGNTPLHLAAKRRSVPIVRLLLANKADRNAKNRDKYTPILSVFDTDDGEWSWKNLNETIEEFASYPDKNNKGLYSAAITLLAKKGDWGFDAIERLYEEKTQPSHFAVKSDDMYQRNYSEMDWLIKNNKLKFFRKLLDFGCNPYDTQVASGSPRLDHSAFGLAIELERDGFVLACLLKNSKEAEAPAIKEFIRQLEQYIRQTIFDHKKRAKTLVAALKTTLTLGKENSIDSCDFSKAESMITAANNVFKLNVTIRINRELPSYHYTQPAKNRTIRDDYNIIIERCANIFSLCLLNQFEKKAAIMKYYPISFIIWTNVSTTVDRSPPLSPHKSDTEGLQDEQTEQKLLGSPRRSS